MDPLAAAQDALNGAADVRIQVYRIDDLDVAVLAGDLRQGVADRFEAGAEALPPMPRDEDEAPAGIEERELGIDPFAQLAVIGDPACCKASITVLPVTWMRDGSVPSRSKFSLASSVGAKWNRLTTLSSFRFTSSGQGASESPLRSPASTCATSIPA
jgi:hypothetical protein